MVRYQFDSNAPRTPNDVVRRWSIFNLLPCAATALLREAAMVDPDIAFGESKARIKAVDEAEAQVKKQFPSYFKE